MTIYPSEYFPAFGGGWCGADKAHSMWRLGATLHPVDAHSEDPGIIVVCGVATVPQKRTDIEILASGVAHKSFEW